eukprot:m.33318 g.33318  ORF g.33318 m.33318 type:complete len:408 (+) comp31801_c0_seq2:14-1237(+)
MESGRWNSKEWRVWMGCLSIGFNLLYLTRATLPIMAVEMAEHFNWQKSTSGVVLSSFYWGYICTQIPGGWLASRFGAEIVLYYSAVVWSMATVLLPFAANSFQALGIIAFRIVAGIAQGTFYPALAVLVATRTSETDRTLSLSIPCAASVLGTLVCSVLASWTVHYSWEYIYYITGSVSLLWAWTMKVCLMSRLKRKMSTNDDTKSVSLKTVFWDSTVLAVCVSHTCDNMVLGIMYSWLPTYSHDFYPDKPPWILSTLPWLAMGVTQITVAAVTDRIIKSGVNIVYVRKSVQAAASLGGAFAMLLLGLGPFSFSITLVLSILALSMNGFHVSGSFSFFTGMKPELAGPLTGLANACGQLPGIFAVSGVGLILESTGGNWTVVFLLISGSLVFGLFCFICVAKISQEP